MPTLDFPLNRASRISQLVLSAILLTAAIIAPAHGQIVDGGRFGRALRPEQNYAAASHNPVYSVLPLTVECWAKLGDKSNVGFILANEPRNSYSHWDLFADKGTGALGASFPGYGPTVVKSDRDVADGKWHYLAMIFDGKTVRLAVDGAEVAAKPVRKTGPYPDTGPLTFGHMDGTPPTAGAMIDEVRISRVVRDLSKVPDAPFTADADTVGLWHFDEDDKAYEKGGLADASAIRNAAALKPRDEESDPNAGFDGSKVAGRSRWWDMDYGSFFSSTLTPPVSRTNVTNKAVSVRLGAGRKHSIAFDTELLRVSAAWSGDFLKIPAFREGLSGPPSMGARPILQTLPGPGWGKGEDFADPRPDKLGPLPADRGKYKGLYVHGEEVAFLYAIDGVDVLDVPGVVETGGKACFTRTLLVGAGDAPLLLRVCDVAGGAVAPGEAVAGGVKLKNDDGVTLVRVVPSVAGAEAPTVTATGGRVVVNFPARSKGATYKVFFATLPEKDAGDFDKLVEAGAKIEDPAVFTHGGPMRYPEVLVTRGELGKADGPYAVDTLTAPDDNPWKSFLRFGGLDFFKNGNIAVCSVSGDVWVVSGIDDKLDTLKWRRYATGLFQPLGLKIVDDKVYVLGRDQITRLHDLDGDGEADFYECFNHDCRVTTNGHAYATCLETDPAGNFYYVKCGDNTPEGGAVLRVSKDGSKLDVFATGVRNSNGLGISPDGQITEADNQGEWVPASRIDAVTQGAFLGFEPMSKRNPPPTDPGKPMVWMPQDVDNSSGGQVWVTSDKWGLPRGAILHTSYGAGSLLRVMPETVDGITQAGVTRFPLNFATGIMRGRFRDADGQLYVCGLKGWQTRGVRDGAIQRVRYTGKPIHMPTEMHAFQNGVSLTFTSPLDRATAEDTGSYGVLVWNYKWSASYGSPHLSVKDPAKQGYDALTIKAAKLSKDGRTVFLEIPEIRPVMQMKISVNIDAADGASVRTEIHNTIHALSPPSPAAAASVGASGNAGAAIPAAAAVLAVKTSKALGAADPERRERKIVLIAGKKSHGPGEHEYEKGCRLLAECLQTGTNLKGVNAVVATDGWPADPKVLDDADAVLLFCDGADHREADHPLLEGDRLAQLGRLMDRGAGLICLHYTVFVPSAHGGKEFQDWIGGYFDYDSTGNDPKKWFSHLGQATTSSTLVTHDHPIVRGVKPFTTRTEYYWRMRFRDNDDRIIPLLTFDPAKTGAPARESVVAWAVQRKDGGRGFAFTEGHFHSNWQIDSYRKLVLNALVWTAGAEVPEGGVESVAPKD